MSDDIIQRLRNSPPREICEHGSQRVKCVHCENDALEDENERLRDDVSRANDRATKAELALHHTEAEISRLRMKLLIAENDLYSANVNFVKEHDRAERAEADEKWRAALSPKAAPSGECSDCHDCAPDGLVCARCKGTGIYKHPKMATDHRCACGAQEYLDSLKDRK